jgi:hypothetical protein
LPGWQAGPGWRENLSVDFIRRIQFCSLVSAHDFTDLAAAMDAVVGAVPV